MAAHLIEVQDEIATTSVKYNSKFHQPLHVRFENMYRHSSEEFNFWLLLIEKSYTIDR